MHFTWTMCILPVRFAPESRHFIAHAINDDDSCSKAASLSSNGFPSAAFCHADRFIRKSRRCNIPVMRLKLHHQIPDAAAHDKCFKSIFMKCTQNTHRTLVYESDPFVRRQIFKSFFMKVRRNRPQEFHGSPSCMNVYLLLYTELEWRAKTVMRNISIL